MGTRQEGDRRARRLLRPLAGERGGRRRTGLPAGEVRMGQGAGDRSGLGHLALRVWTTRTRRDSRAHAPRKREVAPCDGAAEDEIRRRRELLRLQLRLVLRLARRVAARRLALPRHPITPPKNSVRAVLTCHDARTHTRARLLPSRPNQSARCRAARRPRGRSVSALRPCALFSRVENFLAQTCEDMLLHSSTTNL